MKRHAKRGRSWRRKLQEPSLLRQETGSHCIEMCKPARRFSSFLNDTALHRVSLTIFEW